MSESKFGRRLRLELGSLGVRTYRIESHATAPGCPDIHYVCPTGSGWIELKEEPWVLPTKVKYEKQQALWLHAYASAGGRCFTVQHVASVKKMVVICGLDSLLAARRILDARLYTLETSSDGLAGWAGLKRLLLA